MTQLIVTVTIMIMIIFPREDRCAEVAEREDLHALQRGRRAGGLLRLRALGPTG